MTDYKLVPVEPTPEMVSAAEDAYMPFGDMELALRMAILAAPDVQGEPVAYAVFADSGNIRIWSSNPVQAETMRQKYGDQIQPLYTAPQPAEQQPKASAGAVSDGTGAVLDTTMTAAAMKRVANELAAAAANMSDEEDDFELGLRVYPPGIVAEDDDGTPSKHPVLAVFDAEYPEEGIYPVYLSGEQQPSLASPAAEPELSPGSVAAAMQRAWNDFCADSGNYPECFTVRGKELSADFSAGNFARFVARELKAQPAPGASVVAGLVEALQTACDYLPIGSRALELAREALAALASPAAELVLSEPGYACERNLSGKTVGNRCTACMCEEVKAGPRQLDIEDQIKEAGHE